MVAAAAEGRGLLRASEGAILTALMAFQRNVPVALAIAVVPIDVLAERVGTTRGALYKTLHDARHKLRCRVRTPTRARYARAPGRLPRLP
jgi:RNA polymerase sigma-70 factor (ECF subfamily)